MAYVLVALGMCCLALMAISGVANYYMEKEYEEEHKRKHEEG